MQSTVAGRFGVECEVVIGDGDQPPRLNIGIPTCDRPGETLGVNGKQLVRDQLVKLAVNRLQRLAGRRIQQDNSAGYIFIAQRAGLDRKLLVDGLPLAVSLQRPDQADVVEPDVATIVGLIALQGGQQVLRIAPFKGQQRIVGRMIVDVLRER